MVSLPIDALLPEVLRALARKQNLVLTAEPGAGKTTRVAPALVAGSNAQVVVLEPRRLAARLSAVRVADERGERVGGRIGYQVRFDDRSTKDTELVYVTEGILLRRLLADPVLASVRAVVLDEFHERSLQSDLILALLRKLQRRRPDLLLVVMSATLEAEPVAAFLGNCESLHAKGRAFPVEIEHAPAFDARPLEEQVASAVREALMRAEGDLLVFLPGLGEIRRAASRLGQPTGTIVLPLHGSLPPDEQDRAVRPNPLRKVILSTNVAETSLTIDGVSVVVDSGLARVAGHSTWSGLPTLRVMKVSRASATQRAGRAGRTSEGLALRLYTRADHDGRQAQTLAEIHRADLCESVLFLHALGETHPAQFPWYEAPPAEALGAAETLLERLAAIDHGGLTPLGRRMSELPLHPRLSRVLLEAERRSVAREAATMVALLQERELGQPDGREVADSDVLSQLERFEEASRGGLSPGILRRAGVDPTAAQAVARTAQQLGRLVRKPGASPRDVHAELRQCLLVGYPDRVARRRRPGNDELLLSGGGTARLARESVVKDAQLIVAIEAEEQRRAGESAIGLIRSASAIEPEWLLDLFPDRLREERRVRFNAEAERVDVESRLLYDELLLEESRGQATPEELGDALAEAALERGPSAYAPEGEPARTLARVAAARQAMPELALPTLGSDDVRRAVHSLAMGRRRFAELREGDVVELLLADLTPAQRQGLESVAPDSVPLAGGRRLRVNYEEGKAPWVESRLADFFGQAETPRLGKGRLPLTLHLLAPNHRAVQVTADLAGFWLKHYPGVRRELMRRYPRHPWPEDPRQPLPPRPSRGR